MAEAYKKMPQRALGKNFKDIIQQNMDFDNPPIMNNLDVQRLLKVSNSHLKKLKNTKTLESVGKGITRKSVQQLIGNDDLEHIVLLKINEYGALIDKSDNYVRDHIEQGYIRCCDIGTNETNKHYWRVVLFESEYLGLMQRANGIEELVQEEFIPKVDEHNDGLSSLFEKNVYKKKTTGRCNFSECDVRIVAGKSNKRIHIFFYNKGEKIFKNKCVMFAPLVEENKIGLKITDDISQGYKVYSKNNESSTNRNCQIKFTPDKTDDPMLNFIGCYSIGEEIDGWYLLEKEN